MHLVPQRVGATFLFSALASSPALAADVDPFDPSGSMAAGTGGLQVESGKVTGSGVQASLWMMWAQDPAVITYSDDTTEAAVFGTLPMTFHGGYTFEDKVRVEMFVPVYAFVDSPVTDFRGAAFGDIRIQGHADIWNLGDGLALSVIARLGLPTGAPANANISRGIHGGATLAVGGDLAIGFGYAVNAGLTFAPAKPLRNVDVGSTFDAQGGFWYRVTPTFRVGAEARLQLGFLPAQGVPNQLADGHLFAQATLPMGLGLTVGAGSGLWDGVGAPQYRILAALSYSDLRSDSDRDGIVDNDDACIREPEDIDDFEDWDGCPDEDNDEDGVLDIADACPIDAEDLDGYDDLDGCPDNDNDSDGVLDVDDECPVEAGLIEYNGCPKSDRDEDGLADLEDECPDEPGPVETAGCPDADADLVPDFRDDCPEVPKPPGEDPATSDGCPKKVFVTGVAIVITDKVFFETGKAVISSESYELLLEVAQIMIDNPQIKKVEVAGHTDDVGSDTGNQALSERRAAAVKMFLSKHGVDESRLVSKGYGESEPVDTNRTELGRSTNRRVEFLIVEQDRRGPPSPDTQADESGTSDTTQESSVPLD